MGQWSAAVAKLTLAVLLAAGLLLEPGSGMGTAVAGAAGCPSGPVTIKKLEQASSRPGGGLHCYAGHALTFRAYVSPPCGECGGPQRT